MPDETRIFHFHSEAVGDDTFQLGGLQGVETMSRPYEITFDLISKKTDVPLDKMLTSKAWIAIRQSVPVSGGKRGTRLYKLHGIVSEFEVLEKVHDLVKYRGTLVPRLWNCGLTTQSRVFQDVDIKDLIKQVLTDKDGLGLSTPQDFDIKANGPFEKREFVVQYNETDLDFLHRWLEYEGVFYYFDQTESGEKIIFADGTAHYASLPGDPKIPYRPDPASRSRAAGASNEETLQEECIHSFRCLMKKTTKEVVLKDYNYRTPSVEIKAKYDVKNPAGEGKLYIYGEHFKTPKEGTNLAKVRGEEIQCRDKTFDGTGDHRSFRPGTKFTMSEHYRPDFNAAYVLTSIRHKATQGTGAAGGTGGNVSYENEFECIPSDDVFRPERVTPWPSIYGFVNAKVDAGGSGQYAEIDDQGRYKVKLPFDMSDKKDGKASRFIRMAQPYSGANMGMHFPLHKDTEVLLSFIDGDPDRPIIASSIPNAETKGPVNSNNQTQCAIHTGGGTQMVIEDTDGNQRFHVKTPNQSTFIQLGSKSDGGGGSTGTGGGCGGAPAAGETDGAHIGTVGDLNFNSSRDYIRRTGGTVRIENASTELKVTLGDSAEETHGNKREWTKGNSEAETVGNSKETTTGNKEETMTGNSKSVTVGSTDETFTGTKTSKTLSAESEMTLGAKSSLSASAESEITAGAKLEIFGGIKLESTNGLSVEISKGGKATICEAEEMVMAREKEEEALVSYKIKAPAITLDAVGELEIEGGVSVTIKCGTSKITMSPAEIKISSTSIKIEGTGTADVKSDGMTTIKGSAIKLDGPVLEG
jgi:type VI secretion system secreted protein VgrG